MPFCQQERRFPLKGRSQATGDFSDMAKRPLADAGKEAAKNKRRARKKSCASFVEMVLSRHGRRLRARLPYGPRAASPRGQSLPILYGDAARDPCRDACRCVCRAAGNSAALELCLDAEADTQRTSGILSKELFKKIDFLLAHE